MLCLIRSISSIIDYHLKLACALGELGENDRLVRIAGIRVRPANGTDAFLNHIETTNIPAHPARECTLQ